MILLSVFPLNDFYRDLQIFKTLTFALLKQILQIQQPYSFIQIWISMGHFYFEIVPTQDESLGFTGFVGLEVVSSDVGYLLGQLLQVGQRQPSAEIEVAGGEKESQLRGTSTLVEQINEVFQLKIAKILLDVQKTCMVVDQDHKFMRFAHY